MRKSGSPRRRALAAALLLLLAPGLSACSDPVHEETCREILSVLAPEGAGYRVVAVEPDPRSRSGVVIRYRPLRAPAGAGPESRLACHFTGSARPELRRSLLGIEQDGVALSRVKLILLHRWLGAPVPPELLDEGEPGRPWSLGLHAAYLAQQVLNGIVAGSVIALVAVGYTMVYGITRHIQFAYGELVSIGAVVTATSYALLALAGWGDLAALLALGLPAVIAVAALNGWAIERAVFRPLRHSGTQTPLIAAIGLSIFLQEFLRLSQGARGNWIPALLPGGPHLFAGGGFTVTVTWMQLVVVALAACLSLGMGWALARTGYGRSYRACAEDPRMAALLGVDVNRIVAVTYAAGAALAAVSGAAIVLHYGVAGSLTGVLFGFKALTAAVLGGIGSFGGALAGGLLIGLIEALWAGYLGGDFRDAAVFAILVIVLVFKPAGLFGRDDPFTPAAGDAGPGSALRSRPTGPSRW